MKKTIFLVMICCTAWTMAKAQNRPGNIVIVTMDCMRWQEVMKGIDTALLNNKKFTRDSENIVKAYWSDNAEKRRAKLFPFIWSVIEANGQIYGNRDLGNNMNVSNPYWFSYPGYNEIFTGYPDTAVNSNDKVWNKNDNVLAFINQQKNYKDKVAVFATWDCYPYILNNRKNGLYVNADRDSLKFKTPVFEALNDMQWLTPLPVDERPDIITYMMAREYLKTYKPRVLYIAFDETDDYAHAGSYDQYLKSAHAEDHMISDLWNTIQSTDGYKNNTTLLITCDHGRGTGAGWTSHGTEIPHSDQIWMAVMGSRIKHLGEVKTKEQLYQKQLAATIAGILNFQFKADHPVAAPIPSVLN